jgi:hypothetical protein
MIKVFAYRNLHRDCWSLKALEGPYKGRVILHADEAVLVFCQLKVSKAGRQRVLQERKKNVHAGVVGYLDESDSSVPTFFEVNGIPVTYNPYKYESFVRKDDPDTEIHSATFTHLKPTKEVLVCL